MVIRSREKLPCPIDGGELRVIGSRTRGVILPGDEGKTKLVVRRLRCKKCRRIHHELPADLVVPYKRHCAETIDNIVTGNPDATTCGESTINRIRAWWKAILPYFLNILLSLAERYGMTFTNPTTAEIVRAVANNNFWVHTRSVLCPG